MANYYTDSAEWKYHFKNSINWDAILPLYYPTFPTADGFQNRDEVLQFLEELLTTTGKWAAESLAPRSKELDKQGAGTLLNGVFTPSEALNKTYQEAKELDLFGLCMAPHHGGMGVPTIVGLLALEQISKTCVSTMSQLGFFTSIADMIERFCDKDIQDKYIPMIRNGEISGCMCMTEPDAGSDVGSLRTTAKKQPDGSYLVNGVKIFITNGGGGLAFVLGRIDGAPKGLEGLSLFFIEQWPNADRSAKPNYLVTKLEEKMGMHGSATCELVFENSKARLVGGENEGFKVMLHLMNEARICVGLQGLAITEGALAAARTYAEGRQQFGKPLMELPLFKRNFNEWETELDAFRALMADTFTYFDIYTRLDLKKRRTDDLTADEVKLQQKAGRRVRRRTPLVKYYGAEMSATLTQRAIQALGGYGYMAEYEVERFHRDCFGPLLYEGTSQIQALMSMKDLVKFMMKEPARFIQSIVGNHPLTTIGDSSVKKALTSSLYEYRKHVTMLVVRCFRPDLQLSEMNFTQTLGQLKSIIRGDFWQEEGRFDKLMTHAETMCQALSYIETLKVLAKHAAKDSSRVALFDRYHKLIQPRFAAIFADWKLG